MASRQQKSIRTQLATKVRTLEDAVAFERAKVKSSVIIIDKLRRGDDSASVSRLTSYWLGYWDGRADNANGTLPNATAAKQRF